MRILSKQFFRAPRFCNSSVRIVTEMVLTCTSVVTAVIAAISACMLVTQSTASRGPWVVTNASLIEEGDSFELICLYVNSIVRWEFNGVVLEATSLVGRFTYKGTRPLRSELIVRESKVSDSGEFACISRNHGKVTRGSLKIMVRSADQRPQVSIHGPGYDPTDPVVTRMVGDSVALWCSGEAMNGMVWKKGKMFVPASESIDDGYYPTAILFRKENLTLGDAGKYSCLGFPLESSLLATSQFFLQVIPALGVLNSPHTVGLYYGSNLILNCSKDATSGGTDVFLCSPNNPSSFQSLSTMISVWIPEHSRTLEAAVDDNEVVITCSHHRAADVSVSWSKDGEAIARSRGVKYRFPRYASGSALIFSDVSLDDAGMYVTTVTNQHREVVIQCKTNLLVKGSPPPPVNVSAAFSCSSTGNQLQMFVSWKKPLQNWEAIRRLEITVFLLNLHPKHLRIQQRMQVSATIAKGNHTVDLNVLCSAACNLTYAVEIQSVDELSQKSQPVRPRKVDTTVMGSSCQNNHILTKSPGFQIKFRDKRRSCSELIGRTDFDHHLQRSVFETFVAKAWSRSLPIPPLSFHLIGSNTLTQFVIQSTIPSLSLDISMDLIRAVGLHIKEYYDKRKLELISGCSLNIVPCAVFYAEEISQSSDCTITKASCNLSHILERVRKWCSLS